MIKKPSLSIHIELYIIYPSPTINIEELYSLSFISEKLSSLILVSLGLKGKGFRFEKGKIFWAKGKKSAHTPMFLHTLWFGLCCLLLYPDSALSVIKD